MKNYDPGIIYTFSATTSSTASSEEQQNTHSSASVSTIHIHTKQAVYQGIVLALCSILDKMSTVRFSEYASKN